MKISDLVAELEVLQADGDLDVYLYDQGCGCCGGWTVDPEPKPYVTEKYGKYDDLDVGTRIIRLN